MSIICGIYKITSPTGKVYVGQSVHIHARIRQHKKMYNKDCPALYRSMKKHGVDEHIFEIIEQCQITELNDRERFWQTKYGVLGKNGLNCKLTNTHDKSGVQSEKTKMKISMAQRGELNHRYGKKGNCPMMGRKHTLESRIKISKIHKGVSKSQTMKEKLSKKRIGELNPMHGTISPYAKKVIDIVTGSVYDSARQAANELGIKETTLRWWLQGHGNNKTNFKYL